MGWRTCSYPSPPLHFLAFHPLFRHQEVLSPCQKPGMCPLNSPNLLWKQIIPRLILFCTRSSYVINKLERQRFSPFPRRVKSFLPFFGFDRAILIFLPSNIFLFFAIAAARCSSSTKSTYASPCEIQEHQAYQSTILACFTKTNSRWQYAFNCYLW